MHIISLYCGLMYQLVDSHTYRELGSTMEDEGTGESTEEPEERAGRLATLRKRKQRETDKRIESQEQRCEACYMHKHMF